MNLRSIVKWAATLLAVLLLVVGVVAAVRSVRASRQVAQVQELRKKLTDEEAREFTPEQRRELREQLNQEVQKLSPEQRRQLTQQRRRQQAEEIDRFFKLPAQEQTAYLDAKIDEREARRKQREEAQAAQGSGDGTGQTRPTRSDEDRLQFRKEMLDMTTPEQRAAFSAYRRAMQDRQQQRGTARTS